MVDTGELVDVVRQVAAKVAARQAEVVRTPLEREYKADPHDIVTIYDRECEQIARDALTEAYPNAQIIGEEYGSTGESDLVFYLDPIDGTANFVVGLPTFCVSLAAEYHGELIAGVVRAPLLGLEFYAEATRAWVVSGDGERQSLDGGQPRAERDCMVLTSFPSASDHAVDPDAYDRLAHLKRTVSSVRDYGAGALDLALVAAGWADATFGIFTNPWDIAAGALLVRNSGGAMLHYSHGTHEILDVRKPGYAAIARGRDLPVIHETMDGITAALSKRGA